MKTKLENLIDNLLKKLLMIDKDNHDLIEKVNIINNLIENLIDYCIKKNIYYFIENNISYTQIFQFFKNNLCDFINNLIDPENKIIDEYLDNNSNNNLDNHSDINSIFFNNYKNKKIKNKVCFDTDIEFQENSDKKIKNKKSKISENDINKNLLENNKLAIYIKILVNQNKFVLEFIEKLNELCLKILDSDIKLNTDTNLSKIDECDENYNEDEDKDYNEDDDKNYNEDEDEDDDKDNNDEEYSDDYEE